MPNTSSAKKALRSSMKKKEFNLITKTKIKDSLRNLRKVLASKPTEYQASLSRAYSVLDKAVKTKFIKKNKADRKKSRLAAMIAKLLNADK